MKLVGRIASIFGCAVTMLVAEDCRRIRVGDRFVLSVDELGNQQRVGVHQVERVDLDAGVIYAWEPVRHHQPAAANLDYMLTTEQAPIWSPYP